MPDIITTNNGLRTVGEYIPHVRSVAVGCWVRAGSQNETDGNNGVSHLIEHMLFKGTKTRTAKEIAEAMDRLGGQINAYTSKECTCFHVKVMDEHLPQAVEILSDLVLNSKLDEAELAKEKGVIIEEINMVEDSPEDLVHELAAKAHWLDDPLSRTILGPADNIRAMNRSGLIDYMNEMYRPGNCVVAVAGRYDSAEFNGLIDRHFGSWQQGPVPQAPQNSPALRKEVLMLSKDTEQVHLCLGFPGKPQDDADAYPLAVLTNLLGGSMSSRLFQKIREERGLVYSVYAYPTTYSRCGALSIYAGTGPENIAEVVRLIAAELQLLLREGPLKQEVDDAREQLKGSFILGQESTGARMSAIGRQMLLRGRTLSEEEVLARISSVTLDDVARLAHYCFSDGYSAAAVGRLPDNLDIPALMQA